MITIVIWYIAISRDSIDIMLPEIIYTEVMYTEAMYYIVVMR